MYIAGAIIHQYLFYIYTCRPAPTYETATTRQYYHGRTETVRSCTTEGITWAKAMLDKSKTVSLLLRNFTSGFSGRFLVKSPYLRIFTLSWSKYSSFKGPFSDPSPKSVNIFASVEVLTLVHNVCGQNMSCKFVCLAK